MAKPSKKLGKRINLGDVIAPKKRPGAISTQNLFLLLNRDLKEMRFDEAWDDSARKTFKTNKDGATFEFAHKQSEVGFWNGVKYYGSGSHSRIRLPRTKGDTSLPG